MKEVGSVKEVLCRKAFKTKKGETRETLTASDKKLALIAKRSDSANNSPWKSHVLAYCKKKKISYASALGDPNCKSSYKRPASKVVVTKKKSNKTSKETTDST